MLKNYARTALRNLLRHRAHSLINILGLTASLAVGLLVIQILANFFSYDRFHEKKGRLYRVITIRSSPSKQSTFASAPLPLSSALIQECPAVEKTARIKTGFSGNAVVGEKVLRISGMFVDPEFFDMFSFELAYGEAGKSLSMPHSIILTKPVAEALFGPSNPVGQVLFVKGFGDFRVTGVLEDLTHLKTQFPKVCLLAFSSLPLLESQGAISSSLTSWENFSNHYVYLLLRKNASPSQVTSLFPRLIQRHYSQSTYSYDFRLQALTDVTPGEPLKNDMGTYVSMSSVYIISLFALVLILVSVFNYANLSLAWALSRAREVGIRRVVGAQRLQIFLQFLGETVLLALISLIVAYPIYRSILIPLILGMEPELREFFIFQDQPAIIASFVLFAVLMGVAAGAFPAFSISAFKPVAVLKKLHEVRFSRRITLKKALILIQFALCQVFLTTGIIVYYQNQYVRKIDPGFRFRSILTTELGGADFEILKQEMSSFRQILGVSASSHLPARTPLATFPMRRTLHDSPVVFRGLSVDPDFLPNLGIPLIAGRNLPETVTPAAVSPILINEIAARALGWLQPQDAVGQNLIFQDGTSARVIGVVKDFSTGPLYEKVEPCLLKYDPPSFRFVHVRVAAGKLQKAKALLAKAWRDLRVARPPEFEMYEDLIRDQVSDLAVTMKIVAFVAILTIILSCLGLLGVVSTSAAAKTKEIGIRKVVGATRLNIIRGLTGEYGLLLGISTCFGLPISFGINRGILQNYARHISLQPEFFILGVAAMLILGLSVVLTQTVRAALANPVDTLRYE